VSVRPARGAFSSGEYTFDVSSDGKVERATCLLDARKPADTKCSATFVTLEVTPYGEALFVVRFRAAPVKAELSISLAAKPFAHGAWSSAYDRLGSDECGRCRWDAVELFADPAG